jgi:hypothetical protein
MNQAQNGNGPNFEPGVADLIDIELHAALDYSQLVYAATAVPLSINGLAMVRVPVSLSGSYYLTIRHRNSVATTSAIPVSFGGFDFNYAFDNPAKAYGGNLLMTTDGYYLIYSGDVNQDGNIDSGDFTPIDNDQFLFISGYLATDINGDGFIDTADFSIVDNNQFNFVGSILP